MGSAIGNLPEDWINTTTMIEVALSTKSQDLISSFNDGRNEYAPSSGLWLGESSTTCAIPNEDQKKYNMIFNDFNILKWGGLLGSTVFVKHTVLRFFNTTDGNDEYCMGCEWRPVGYYWFVRLWKQIMNGGGEISANVYSAEVSDDTTLVAVRDDNVAVLNLGDAKKQANFSVWNGQTCDVYTISPDWTTGGPDGFEALVNGERVSIKADGSSPIIYPLSQPCDMVSLPQYGVIFVSTQGARNNAVEADT